MEPTNILASIAGGFLGGLDKATMFAAAVIVFVWFVYKESVWKRIKP